MVTSIKFKMTSSLVATLHWQLLRNIHPSSYRLVYECKMLSDDSVYARKVIILNFNHTSCPVGTFRLKSKCTFDFLAIYNYASLDPGIRFTLNPDSLSKCMLVTHKPTDKRVCVFVCTQTHTHTYIHTYKHTYIHIFI